MLDIDVGVDISSHTGLSNGEVAKILSEAYQLQSDGTHFVYCFSFEKDGRTCWYVGETANLKDRISTHARTKKIVELETVEEATDRTHALEREREMSYEVAINKQTTDIYGGR